MGTKTFYHYPCFVVLSHKFGLLDDDGDLRCTSAEVEGVLKYKLKVGWGTIIKIKVTKNGIKFIKGFSI